MTAELTDHELVERLPQMNIEHHDAEHYRGWLRGELVFNRCQSCGEYQQPMRPMCPRCWSWAMTPTAVSGRGRVHLLLLLHQGPAAPGVEYANGPHPVVTVELEEQEGLRYTSTVIDIAASEITIGMPVELAWIDRGGVPFPVFRRA